MNRHRDDADDPGWRALPVDAGELTVEQVLARIAAGIEPDTPEEYILRVRLQAETIPDVLVAEAVDPRSFDARVTIATPAALPGTAGSWRPDGDGGAWTRTALASFEALHGRVLALQHAFDAGAQPRPAPLTTTGTGIPTGVDLRKWIHFALGHGHPAAGTSVSAAPASASTAAADASGAAAASTADSDIGAAGDESAADVVAGEAAAVSAASSSGPAGGLLRLRPAAAATATTHAVSGVKRPRQPEQAATAASAAAAWDGSDGDGGHDHDDSGPPVSKRHAPARDDMDDDDSAGSAASGSADDAGASASGSAGEAAQHRPCGNLQRHSSAGSRRSAGPREGGDDEDAFSSDDEEVRARVLMAPRAQRQRHQKQQQQQQRRAGAASGRGAGRSPMPAASVGASSAATAGGGSAAAHLPPLGDAPALFGSPPLLSSLLAIDQVLAARLLRRLAGHFERRRAGQHQAQPTDARGAGVESSTGGSGGGVASASAGAAAGVSPPQPSWPALSECLWAFALLARIDKPLHADVGATVRQLFVACRALLLAGTPVAVDAAAAGCGGDSPAAVVAAVRLLATVAGDFFRQRLATSE